MLINTADLCRHKTTIVLSY